MPVIAKLSREFYDTLGNKVADELVNWFNQVDATYRAELKDLFEVHFSRFDAKLEQRTTQLDAKLEQRTAQLDAKLEQRLAESEAKWDRRMAESDVKWERRFAESDLKWEQRFSELEKRMAESRADFGVKLERRLGEQTRWLFGAWVIVLGSVIGLWFRV
jgi:hypothetical protein